MLCGRAGKRGRVPGAAMPGCCVPGLVAAEDLQDFAQVLRVGSFQVQMVMSKFRRLLPSKAFTSLCLGSSGIRKE